MVSHTGQAPHAGLRFIALFKFVKGVLLLLAAIGALRLLHHDAGQLMTQAVSQLRMDPQGRFIRVLLSRLTGLDDRTLKQMSAASFFYSTLLFTEGIGLWLSKRWAEYLTIVLTSSFLPIELYEMARRLTLTKATIFAINLAIVLYLVRIVRSQREAQRLSLPLETDPAT